MHRRNQEREGVIYDRAVGELRVVEDGKEAEEQEPNAKHRKHQLAFG
jgi:hypothetical protein